MRPGARPADRTGRAVEVDVLTVPRASGGRPLRTATVPRLALSLVLLCALWWIAGPGTWAALSGTTANPGNSFSAGTVTMTDNDVSAAMFTFTDQKPGVLEDGCIQVGYTGSVDASAVRLYATVSGAMAPYLSLTVTRGTDAEPSFDDCAGFRPDPTDYTGLGPGVLFDGTLAGFPTTYATGLVDPLAPWTADTTASYQFTVQVVDDDEVQGLSTSAGFTWEARS